MQNSPTILHYEHNTNQEENAPSWIGPQQLDPKNQLNPKKHGPLRNWPQDKYDFRQNLTLFWGGGGAGWFFGPPGMVVLAMSFICVSGVKKFWLSVKKPREIASFDLACENQSSAGPALPSGVVPANPAAFCHSNCTLAFRSDACVHPAATGECTQLVRFLTCGCVL